MRSRLAAVVAALVAVPVALVATPASADGKRLWEVEVAKIPTAEYTRDAQVYITESTEALRPYVGDGLGDSRIDPVLADVGSRYFDGARFKGAGDGAAAFDNLKHLEAFLKSRLTGASPPNGEAEQAHVVALVETLSGARLLADAAIQDAEATIGPFRASPPPAPAPVGLTEAFADLAAAKVSLAKADDMLVKANPVPATINSADAWAKGFNVLARLGITYDGDHDSDGVVDVVELRFGSSPLLVDSDGDGLTDKFEITKLAGWTMPGRYDTDGDGTNDGAEDVDGDGLSNLREQELGTSPTEADTDGDGLSDGAEVAQGRNPLVADNPPPPVSSPTDPVQTTPTDTDTDGDGIADTTEVDDSETDPANPDTDGDGLGDGAEINEHLTNPLSSDTDGDGLADAYELAHAEDQGLDPLIPDERVSKWTYVTDFVVGLIAGDFSPRDSMAWLSGYLCSGGLSLIPVVGWVLGGLADLRDTVAAIIHQDWVGAGLSILGLVPYVGDAVAIPGKAAKFVARYLHRLDKVIHFVAKYDKISDSVKTLTIRAILLGNYSRLTDAGFADDIILRLARRADNSLGRLADALTSAVTPPPSPTPWLRGANAGEDYFADVVMAGVPGVRNHAGRIATPGVPRPGSAREPDFLETGPPRKLHEVKTGKPYPGHYLKQCAQDRHLLDTAQVAEVMWHFMPHANGSLDIPQDLLDCLRSKRIPFKIYPSNGSFWP
ncbi:hypothetical protein K7640_15720 [Micromonospora sp. PLK6-60]|uniref:hypothetical protein n=1 Tax=Micromonospora sp. PLK6-60 TaxID=2873383 RepID=UPI001CA625F0|nr:hypothetical protein [Micromonospora sp. PLK6-60]MBY8873282.1 hypothetical protein [Micromonospora sp. PLK6-60]